MSSVHLSKPKRRCDLEIEHTTFSSAITNTFQDAKQMLFTVHNSFAAYIINLMKEVIKLGSQALHNGMSIDTNLEEKKFHKRQALSL